MDTGPGTKGIKRRGHLLRGGAARARCSEQDDLPTSRRKPAAVRGLTEHTFRPVAHHGATESLCSSEGDPTRIAFADGITYNHSDQRMVVTPSLGEHPLEVPAGLDGLHASRLLLVAHRQTLAPLGAATGEHGAAALGGHTGTEAVGLGALALIRLIRTLHGVHPPGAFGLLRQNRRLSLQIVVKGQHFCQSLLRKVPKFP